MRATKLFISSAILMLLACGGAGSQIDGSSGSDNASGTGSIQTSPGDGGNSSSVGGGSSGSSGGINSGNSDGGTLDGPVGGGTSDGEGGSGGTLDGSGSDTSSGGTSDGLGGLGGTGDGVTGGALTSDGEGGTGSTNDGVGGSGASDDGVGGSGGTLDGIGGSGASNDGVGGIGGTLDGVGGSGATDDGIIILPPPAVPPPPVGGTEDNVGGTGNTEDNIGGTGNTADAIPTAPPPPTPPPANTQDNVDGGVTSDCPVSCPPIMGNAYMGGAGTGGTSGFNTMVLNNAVLENVDTQGRMYVGNNFTTPGYTVGSNMPYSTTRMDLVVGNNLTVQASSTLWGLTVQNGLIAYGGALSGAEYINTNLTDPVAGTPPGVVYSKPMVPAEVTADLRSWSTQLTTLAATGTVSGSTFFCGSEPLCVIFASPSNLTSQVTVSAPAGTMVVLNINGTSAAMSNYAVILQGGIIKNNVLFNFYQATNLSISAISVQGSILAPLADLYFTNANIEGQLVVNNWVMPAGVTAGEVHDYLLSSCPELCP